MLYFNSRVINPEIKKITKKHPIVSKRKLEADSGGTGKDDNDGHA